MLMAGIIPRMKVTRRSIAAIAESTPPILPFVSETLPLSIGRIPRPHKARNSDAPPSSNANIDLIKVNGVIIKTIASINSAYDISKKAKSRGEETPKPFLEDFLELEAVLEDLDAPFFLTSPFFENFRSPIRSHSP